jgi:membrane-associated protease RseP (regulator of RpoE activity)
MSFIFFDIAFFIVLCIFIALFLLKNKKNVKVESKIFLLYKTKLGIKFINWFSKKFPKFLNFMSYFTIGFGVIAMIGAFWILYKSLELIITLATIPNVPPIMPLVPYLPQALKLPLPPFYFIYWILIILIIAVVHELAHGFYSALYKIKIKSTGFGFLGPFLAAFVEPDEKKLAKSKPRKQMTILAAGSFSNFIFGVIFLLLLQLFFISFYSQGGVSGYLHYYEQVNVSSIEKIAGYPLGEFSNISNAEIKDLNSSLIEIKTLEGKSYYITEELFDQLDAIRENKSMIVAYMDYPAIKANLSGAIIYLDDYKINKISDMENALANYVPGDEIMIRTTEGNYSIVLAEHPLNSSKVFIGIGYPQSQGFGAFIQKVSSPFFTPNTYAEPRFNAEVLTFFRDLLVWLIIISFSVAFINMLPVSVLDGGKFIYNLVLGLTKSKKAAEVIYRICGYVILSIVVAMTLVWVVRKFI